VCVAVGVAVCVTTWYCAANQVLQCLLQGVSQGVMQGVAQCVLQCVADRVLLVLQCVL